jgi:hypothetical protein
MKTAPFVILCAMCGSCLIASAKDGEEGRKPLPARPPGRGPTVSPADLVKRFDINRDGKLSESESKTMRETLEVERQKAMMARFDSNGDGVLSEEEHKAMQSAIAADRERAMIAKFDTDGDGVISEAERKAVPTVPGVSGKPPSGPGVATFKPGPPVE